MGGCPLVSRKPRGPSRNHSHLPPGNSDMLVMTSVQAGLCSVCAAASVLVSPEAAASLVLLLRTQERTCTTHMSKSVNYELLEPRDARRMLDASFWKACELRALGFVRLPEGVSWSFPGLSRGPDFSSFGKATRSPSVNLS